MTDTPLVSVVLPAHNEADLLEQSVAELVKGLSDRGEPFELIIVENGSSDTTAALARRLEADLCGVRALSLPVADYGRAVARGFEEAAAPAIVLFDVDYFDLGFLDEALRTLRDGTAGIVLASKRAPGADDRRPARRRLLTAGFTAAMRLLLGIPVSDAHGMKAISKEHCAPLVGRCSMGGSLFDVELVLRASRAGVPIIELPAQVSERRPPRTPLTRRSLESAVGLLKLRKLIRRELGTRSGRPSPG
ncbi:MAG: glycosyltransferase family 2 protein [Actinomycetota bacterium]|nr:glycosyltransferase family 2 protein [Actinomycetota bacterium]